MTQEDKELLIRDLCARLPYGVKCKIENSEIYNEKLFDKSIVGKLNGIFNNSIFIGETTILQTDKIEKLKPYLRPMSSMTEEEHDDAYSNEVVMSLNPDTGIYAICALSPKGYDWLNAHHFDYRGLIEKGLALEAPEGMYND